MARSLRHLAGIVLLAVVYALVAKASLSLDAIQGFATLVWPPTGIALAAVLLVGYGVWPGVAIGAFAANVWQGAPPSAAVGIAIGNTMEAVVGAYLLHRAGFRTSFDRLKDVVAFVGLGALCAPLASATVGPLSLWAANTISTDHVAEAWLAWWMGDACGALVVGSLLLTWASPRAVAPAPARFLEIALLSVLLVVAALVPMIGTHTTRSVAFLVFPLLIWATVRFGQRGATAAAAFVATAAVESTALGYGPFMSGPLHERLWTLQAYIIVMVVTLLVLGAVTEERVRAGDALRRALDAREEFLSIASHELKTPLSAMVLSLSGLQRSFRRGEEISADAVGQKVERVMRQTGRLTALINQLLDVSRISNSTLELVRQDLDLHEVVLEVCGRFSEEAARAGSSLSITGAASLRGRWDRLRIEQVLSNLLSNAIRYGDGGPIEVSLSLEEHRELALIVVRDQGKGIEPDALPTIFDRFNSSKASRRYGGLGLGLYISSQIVKGHGGSLRAASTVGKGSTFVVELPVSPPGWRTPEQTDEPGRDQGDEIAEHGDDGSTHHDSR